MTYPGGKATDGVYQAIINQMPPHTLYIEAFLGGGAIMLKKKPAATNVGIDADMQALTAFPAGMVQGVTLIHADSLAWLAAHGPTLPASALIYADPPYLMETRRSQRQLYRYEMAERDEHERLLAILMGLPCMVMLSGYYSDLYADRLVGWRSTTFTGRTRSGATTTEWLWMNFPQPTELHDYRWLGSNYRQREWIKRKQARWVHRLERMSDLERYAMLSVIDSLRARAAPCNSAGARASAEQVIPDPHVILAGTGQQLQFWRWPPADNSTIDDTSCIGDTTR